MSFKIDDTVKWTSQAGGRTKTKTGVIEQVIPAGQRPPGKGWGSSRNHESYLVRVGSKLYWPVVGRGLPQLRGGFSEGGIMIVTIGKAIRITTSIYTFERVADAPGRVTVKTNDREFISLPVSKDDMEGFITAYRRACAEEIEYRKQDVE